MPVSTANVVSSYSDLTRMLHDYYTIGQRITDYVMLQGISNTNLNAICAEVKSHRPRANSTHTGILSMLSGN